MPEIPYTLLALPRYAQIMGINPAHFMRASAYNLSPQIFPIGSSCDSVWPRHTWQRPDYISHEELAEEIKGAEEDVAKLVGFYPAPIWVRDEMHRYPRIFEPTYYGIGENVRGQAKALKLEQKRLIAQGVRATTLVATATTVGGTLVYSDEDGDGFDETATITVPNTNLPDNFSAACQIKLYYAGKDGEPEWEIRPLKSVSFTATDVVITLNTWLMLKLELIEAFPTDDEFRAIDVSTDANFVTSVDVYREYNDTTSSVVTFYWDPLSGDLCNTAEVPCSNLTQGGCLYTIDPNTSTVSPIAASYDNVDAAWEKATGWTGTVEPDRVSVSYYAGDRSKEYLAGRSCDPLSYWWAQIIAWIATARLSKPLCECSNAQKIAEDLATDLSYSTRGETYFVPREILRNPLGTRKGEVKAWQRISRVLDQPRSYATI